MAATSPYSTTNPRQSASPDSLTQPVKRVRVWYSLIIVILAVFLVRLFYLQIIRFEHYKHAALSDQLKQYEIPASRGIILAHDGSAVLPIVLNQKLYNLYADPVYVKDAPKVALAVSTLIGGDAETYAKKLATKDSRYVVLAKKLSETQRAAIVKLKLRGLGTQEQDYRIYPQGALAAQVLGFVNDGGKGTYGVEQALNPELSGKSGELRAITDINGVPLAANSGNIQKPATPGKDVVLSLNIAMQKQLETLLQVGLARAKSDSGSALIIDPQTGKVRAMANYPSYNPTEYSKVEDTTVFDNASVSRPIEIGSIMKTLTTAAALDSGAVKSNTTYYDPASWKVDGFTITNIEEDGGAGTRNITDILNLSLNTGATWELMRMGGGQINQKARDIWYDYMANHYQFGKLSNIEQGYDTTGVVPKPDDNGAGINLTYANTTFGQAMTATPLQVAAALSAVVNGGTYYRPQLIDGSLDGGGMLHAQQPQAVRSGVVSASTSRQIISLMQYVVDHHNFKPTFDQSRYSVGGKTGTAQIAKPGGGYLDKDFNGTYLGFVGGDSPQYVIAVFVNKPRVSGYAGTAAAQPIFSDVAHMLINNSYVIPKK